MKTRILRIIPIAWEGYAQSLSKMKSRWDLIYGNEVRKKYEIVDVYLKPAFKIKWLGVIGYYVGYFIGAIVAFLHALLHGQKVYHAEFAYTVPFAYLCKAIKRGKLVVDWTDVEPYAPPYMFARRARRLKIIAMKIVRAIFLKHADLLFVCTGWARDDVLKISSLRGKVIFFPNLPTEEIKFAKKKDFEGKIMYYGKIVPEYRIERAVYLIGALKKEFPDAKLILVGAGKSNYIEYLKKLAKSLGADKNIVFMEPMPYKKLIDFMSKEADICVLPFGASSLKLWEWAMAGKPIVSLGHYIEDLGFRDGVHAMIIKDNPSDPHNEKKMALEGASAVATLFRDPLLREKLAQNARQLVMNYNPSKLDKIISEYISKIVES